MTEQRLYGVPGAEEMYFDPYSCYESDIDGNFDVLNPQQSFVLEEWSVHPPEYHLPTADRILEWIDEYASDNEVTEGWSDNFPLCDELVVEHTNSLIRLIASNITFRMADEKIAEHIVTWRDDEEHTPLLDGELMYVKRVTE